MKRIKEFLNPDLTEEKESKVIKEMLEEKFDSELKRKYSETLQKEYNVHRDLQKKPKSIMLKILFSIILLSMLLGGYSIIKNMLFNGPVEVQQYVAQNEMKYFGNTRNDASGMTKDKMLAYDTFNKGNFHFFEESMAKVKNLTFEDRFFLAYVKLKSENYEAAAKDFDQLTQSLKAGDQYYEESKLYYGICLYKIDSVKFQEYYSSLKAGSWEKDELAKIIK